MLHVYLGIWSSQQPYKIYTIIISTSQMSKLRPNEVTKLMSKKFSDLFQAL